MVEQFSSELAVAFGRCRVIACSVDQFMAAGAGKLINTTIEFSATPGRPIRGNATLRATLLRVHADGYRLMVGIDQYRVGSHGSAHVAPRHEAWHGLCWLVGQEGQPRVRSLARTNDVRQEETDDAIPQSA